MIPVRDVVQTAWRPFAALALVVALLMPCWAAQPARAQATLPLTAEVAPAATAIYSEVNLDFTSAQWQQADALLQRVGIPNALEQWRDEMLRKGAREGDFSAADLNALLGGELAVIVSPEAIGQLARMHMAMHDQHAMAGASEATPGAAMSATVPGIVVVLRPGDPAAAWAYAKRQLDAYADKKGIALQTGSHGSAELIWGMPATTGDAATSGSGDMYGDWFMHHGRGEFAVAHTGDYIIAGKTQADVTPIVDVIDGASGSLADAVPAQEIAAALPADSLSFTYVDNQAILDGLGPEATASVEAMLPANMPQESLGGAAGFALSAEATGFRLDSVMKAAAGGNLDMAVAPNDAAVAAAAEQAPAGTFLFVAERLADQALAGIPFVFSQAVNEATSGAAAAMEERHGPLPSPEEMEAEIAKAAAVLQFDPRRDLFDLLGRDFVAYSSFPGFGMSGGGLNAVAAISTTDPGKLAATASKFAGWIERIAPHDEVAVSTRTVGSDTVYTLSDPKDTNAPALDFGVVGGQAVVAVGSGLDELGAAPAASLADDQQFQAVMAALPSEYSEVLYIDLAQAMRLAAMMHGGMAEATPAAMAGSLENIRALAAVTYRDGDIAGSSAVLYIAGS